MKIHGFFYQFILLSVALIALTNYAEFKWLSRGNRRVESLHEKNLVSIRTLESDEDRSRFAKRKLFHTCGQNEVENGDAESGAVGPFNPWHCSVELESPGFGGVGSAFKVFDPSYHGGGLYQQLDTGCILAEGYTWRFQAKIKMYDQTTLNGVTTCDPAVKDKNCPRVEVITQRRGEMKQSHIYDEDMVWNPNDWNTFDGFLKTTPENSGNAIDYLGIIFQGGPPNSVMLIDDVIIQRLESFDTPTTQPSSTPQPSDSPTGFCTKEFGSNTDMETGNTLHWAGLSGTPLDVESPGYGGSGYALKAYDRASWFSGAFQFLDHTCLTIGSSWSVKAKFKLYSQTTNTVITTCDPTQTNDYGCPFAILQTAKHGGKQHFTFFNSLNRSYDGDGWETFESIVTMTSDNSGPEIEQAKMLYLGGPPDSVLLIDDISVRRLSDYNVPTAAPTLSRLPTSLPTGYCNKNWVAFGDFENESMYGWMAFGGEIAIESPGADGSNFALKTFKRPGSGFGPFLWSLDIDCVEENSIWHFEFKAKLVNETGGAIFGDPATECNPMNKDNNCPHVRIMSRHDGMNYWAHIYDQEMTWDPNGWSHFSVDYTLPPILWSPDLSNFWPFIVGGPLGSTLLIDDITIRTLGSGEVPTIAPTTTSLPSASPTIFCNKNFIRNGDAEFGSSSYFMGWDNPIGVETPGYGGLGYALKAYNRNSWHRGIAQVIDYSCAEIGSNWRFRMQVRLFDQTTNAAITSCDPTDTTNYHCPLIRLVTKKNSVQHYTVIQDKKMIWNPNDWSTFDVVIRLTEENGGPDVTWMLAIFSGGPPNSILLVDNARVERLEDWETPTASPTQTFEPTQFPTELCSKNFARNGDAESGTTTYWTSWGNSIGTQIPGYDGTGHALMANNRRAWQHGIGQWLDYSCVSVNSTWHFKAKVRLYDEETNAGITTCNPLDYLSNDCPMVRLVTLKNGVTENRFDVYRDGDMIWNPDGWSDFDIKVHLTPENSGYDLVKFFPNFVGGPVGSVLLLDDVSITLVTDPSEVESVEEAVIAANLVPFLEICHSIGDPHIMTFDGLKFDNHHHGWQLLYELGKAKVEAYHDFFINGAPWTSNTQWKVSYDNVIVGYGTNGTVPPGPTGTIFLTDPDVWVRIQASEMMDTGAHDIPHQFIYNIFITTANYSLADGFCAETDDDCDEAPEILNTTHCDVTCAEQICYPLLGMLTYDECIADASMIDDEVLSHNALNSTSDANDAETQLNETISNVDQPVNTTDSDEEELANTIPPEEVVDDIVDEVINGGGGDPEEEDDEGLSETARSLEEDVELEGNENEDGIDSGVNGDPLIMGLQNQAFNFDGKTDTWYANVATEKLQWNMKFHNFTDCLRDDSMYVTEMAFSVDKTTGTLYSDGAPHNILISMTNVSQTFPGCPPGQEPCLGDGSLQITVDGQVYTQPGNYNISDNLRIIAHNTYDSCSRHWYDYDTGIALRQEEESLMRKLFKGRKDEESFVRKLFRRQGHHSFSDEETMDFVRDSRRYMLKPHECSEWIRLRTQNQDLFRQLGGWSTIYIVTPVARWHVEYRQIEKSRAGVGGGSGLEEDITVNGVLFPGSGTKCQSHVIDAWMTHASPETRAEKWSGILGETRTVKINDDGYAVTENRDLLLMGNDVDYEVNGGAFGRDFAARDLQLEFRRLLSKNKHLIKK